MQIKTTQQKTVNCQPLLAVRMGKVEDPECTHGYPELQLQRILGDRYAEFCHWIAGQTMLLCDGTRYDFDTHTRVSSGCGRGHGIVAYSWDVQRFLDNRPVID